MEDLIIAFALLLLVTISLYSLFFAVMTFASLKKKKIALKDKYIADDLPGNLMVIIYVPAGDRRVLNLVSMLENQTYPKDNYKIFTIFDNSCDDETIRELERDDFVNVIKLNNGTEFGKDESIAAVLSKLASFRNINAFVFLDTDRIIKNNFLSEINKILFSCDVVTGASDFVAKNLKGKILSSVWKYENRIFNSARTVLQLPVVLDTGCCAIKQSIFENLESVDFSDGFGKYKFTQILLNKGIIPYFAPEVKSEILVPKFSKRSIFYKFKLFKFLKDDFLSSNWRFKELILFECRPSGMLIFIIWAFLILFTANFDIANPFLSNQKMLWFLFALGIFCLSVTLHCVKTEEKVNPFIFLLYPIFWFRDTFDPSANKLPETKKSDSDKKPGITEYSVYVTDENRSYDCYIGFINERDGIRASFRYKNKIMTSDIYKRTLSAIGEIDNKLEQNGMKLKMCATCAHFGLRNDAGNNPVTGLCSCSDKMTDNIAQTVHITDMCNFYKSPSEIDNIAKIDDYRPED